MKGIYMNFIKIQQDALLYLLTLSY